MKNDNQNARDILYKNVWNTMFEFTSITIKIYYSQRVLAHISSLMSILKQFFFFFVNEKKRYHIIIIRNQPCDGVALKKQSYTRILIHAYL